MDEVDTDDDALIALAVSGHAQAFTQLIRRYDKATRSAAFAAVGPNGPFEDALQEGLLKCYRSLGSFKSGGNFQSWLCRIVHNAAIDEMRKTKRVIPMFEVSASSAASFEGRAVHDMDLRSALDALPPKQRAALILVDIQGYDYQAAADLIGVPIGTIASRVNSARGALRTAFSTTQKDGV